MKKEFKLPELEIIEFTSEDILSASGGVHENEGEGFEDLT